MMIVFHLLFILIVLAVMTSFFPTNNSLFPTPSIDRQDQRCSLHRSTLHHSSSLSTPPHNSTHISPSTRFGWIEITESTVLTTPNPQRSYSHSTHTSNYTRTEAPADETHPSQTQSETWTLRSLPSIHQLPPSNLLANDQTESAAE